MKKVSYIQKGRQYSKKKAETIQRRTWTTFKEESSQYSKKKVDIVQ